jgi:crotonobetaine/carnitine-CoA ligase
MLDNSVDFIVTWIGIAVSPFVEVPVNTSYAGSTLAYVLRHSAARVAIVEARCCAHLAAIAEEIPDLDTVIVRGSEDVALPPQWRRVDFDALTRTPFAMLPHPHAWDRATVTFTSGTTGPSKGVVVTHGFCYASASTGWPPVEQNDVMLITLPLFHIGGRLSCAYNALIAGATFVVRRGFDAASFWDDVDAHGCTVTLLVGAMAEQLWQLAPRADDAQHPLARAAIAPMYPRFAAFNSRFGVVPSMSYGSSEVGCIMRTVADYRSCGVPRPDIEVRVVDEHDVEVAPGAVGELIVRSREPWALMSGYHDMPEATANAWRNLWFHTGDAFVRDAAGALYFVDRVTDVVRRRSEVISTAEIESYIALHDSVRQVAVVAVPGDDEDELMAFLVTEAGRSIDVESVMRELASDLPASKVPRYVEIIDSLPMTPTLKVQKGHLRQRGPGPGAWDLQAKNASPTTP